MSHRFALLLAGVVLSALSATSTVGSAHINQASSIVSGELTLSHEGSALRYWPIDEMRDWHGTHEINARAAYEVWKSPDILAKSA